MQHVWHYEGPFEVSTCEGILSVPVSGLKAGEHYTAAVVVFNRESSFKSKSIDICKYWLAYLIMLVLHCKSAMAKMFYFTICF